MILRWHACYFFLWTKAMPYEIFQSFTTCSLHTIASGTLQATMSLGRVQAEVTIALLADQKRPD